jgi:hypothetical protein
MSIGITEGTPPLYLFRAENFLKLILVAAAFTARVVFSLEAEADGQFLSVLPG